MVDLNEHLPYTYRCQSRQELRALVDKLLTVDTCFAVIGGELEIRFHDRGAAALGMDIPS